MDTFFHFVVFFNDSDHSVLQEFLEIKESVIELEEFINFDRNYIEWLNMLYFLIMQNLKLCIKTNNSISKLQEFDNYIVYTYTSDKIISNYEETAKYLINCVWNNQRKNMDYLKMLFFVIVESPESDYDDVFWWSMQENENYDEEEEEEKLCRDLCRHFGKLNDASKKKKYDEKDEKDEEYENGDDNTQDKLLLFDLDF